MARIGKSFAMVARTLLQSILYYKLNVAPLAAKTCTQAYVNLEGANKKGEIRFECATIVHLTWNKG